MLVTFPITEWDQPITPALQHDALAALESGSVIFLPKLSFILSAQEQALLSPTILHKRSKNISFNPATGVSKGSKGLQLTQAASLMQRFYKESQRLIHHLVPSYQPYLQDGRTSYRPAEVAGRKGSLRKDDTRLHVDAFSATPNHGRRILRVFSNINPMGHDRVWQLGEPFPEVVKHFTPRLRGPFPGTRRLFAWLGITKSYRSLYDHYMLRLHDQMKINHHYQQHAKRITVQFPANATWIVMTDVVSHAALSGQFLLEQTFYLPATKMRDPELSPLRILESHLQRSLIDV